MYCTSDRRHPSRTLNPFRGLFVGVLAAYPLALAKLTNAVGDVKDPTPGHMTQETLMHVRVIGVNADFGRGRTES